MARGLDVLGRKFIPNAHPEEKDFTNRIFHGKQCRGLAIHTQLSSLCLKFDLRVRR